SRSTSLSGGGRKSSTILIRPMLPFVYLAVGFLIGCPSLSPIARTKNPDLPAPPRKAHGHDRAVYPAETKITPLILSVTEVLCDHTKRIEKGMLGAIEPDAMFGSIGPVLCGIPFEIGHENGSRMYRLPYLGMAGKASLDAVAELQLSALTIRGGTLLLALPALIGFNGGKGAFT